MAQSSFNGYTVPVVLYYDWEGEDNVLHLYVPGNLHDLQTHWPEFYSSEELDDFFNDLRYNDCTAGGIYDTFTKEEVIYIVYIEEGDGWDTSLLDCTEVDTVTIEYYVGSAYHEIELPACLEYWNFPSEERFGLDTERTTEGYYRLDSSGLERGTYGIHFSYSYDNSYYWNGELDPFYSSALLFSIG